MTREQATELLGKVIAVTLFIAFGFALASIMAAEASPQPGIPWVSSGYVDKCGVYHPDIAEPKPGREKVAFSRRGSNA